MIVLQSAAQSRRKEAEMASKYVNVCGKRIRYNSGFCFRPYCFFDLKEDEYGMILEVIDSILRRCHKAFKSAEVLSIEMLQMRNNIWECKVIFSISENERLAYEREVKDGK